MHAGCRGGLHEAPLCLGPRGTPGLSRPPLGGVGQQPQPRPRALHHVHVPVRCAALRCLCDCCGPLVPAMLCCWSASAQHMERVLPQALSAYPASHQYASSGLCTTACSGRYPCKPCCSRTHPAYIRTCSGSLPPLLGAAPSGFNSGRAAAARQQRQGSSGRAATAGQASIAS